MLYAIWNWACTGAILISTFICITEVLHWIRRMLSQTTAPRAALRKRRREPSSTDNSGLETNKKRQRTTTWVRKPDVPLKAQTMLLKLLGEHFEEIMGWSPHTTGKRSRRGSSSSSHTSSLSTPPSSLRSSWSWCPGPSQRYASMSDTSSSSMDSCNHSTRSSISSVYISEPSLRCSPSPRYGRKFGPGSKTVSSFEASVRSTPKSSIDSSRRPSHIYGLLSSIGSIPRPSLRSSPTPGCGRKYKPRISTTSRSRTKLISNSMNNISSSSTTRKRYYLRSSTQSSSTSSFEDNHGYGHRYGPRASSNHTSTASIRSISSSTESDSYPDTP